LAEGEAGFVCGEIELAAPESLLWQALPAEIVIRQNQAGPILARLVELIIHEAAGMSRRPPSARHSNDTLERRREHFVARRAFLIKMSSFYKYKLCIIIHNDKFTPTVIAITSYCFNPSLSQNQKVESWRLQWNPIPMRSWTRSSRHECQTVGVAAVLIPATGPEAMPPLKTWLALKGRKPLIRESV
jgi:hypothetical protein